MNSTKSSLDTSSSYKDRVLDSQEAVTPPCTLILDNQTVHLAADGSMPLYRLSRSITTFKQEPSSVQFDSVEHLAPYRADSGNSLPSSSTHLYYLVHPINARYRSDKPAYYATANPGRATGNLVLQASTSKNPLQKPEFVVLESAGRTAASDDLFADAKDQQVLFTTKQKWTSARRVWRGSSGEEIAIEEDAVGTGGTRKLDITQALDKASMNALVVAWCLKSWYDVAESKEATKSVLEDITPPESRSGMGMKWTKMTSVMAGLGAGGGGGGM